MRLSCVPYCSHAFFVYTDRYRQREVLPTAWAARLPLAALDRAGVEHPLARPEWHGLALHPLHALVKQYTLWRSVYWRVRRPAPLVTGPNTLTRSCLIQRGLINAKIAEFF